MQVAIFGGSFNPPHVSHVLAVTYVLSVHAVDRVLVVPVFRHPFLKALAPFEARVQMCRLAMGWIRGVEVSRVEESLEGPSLTIRTLRRLTEQHPDWTLRLVVGADVLDDADDWHAWDEVVKLAPLIVLGRAGVKRPDAPRAVLPEVSSTRIRELLAERGDEAELTELLPLAVRRYVDEHGLYR